ncbi:MAG: siderophore-interacting protein [Rhodococcus sp. (in: high G+C Gram-positive bacteria)]
MPRNTRPTTAYPVTLRELEVCRVADVTPGMRRVTLTGTQLETFTNADGHVEPAFTSTGFDDDIRLLFAYPGETDPVLPVMVDGSVTFAAGRRPLARAYTVRRYDPRTRELEVDFVVHGSGVATAWARGAGPGDRMHIAGPSVSQGLPEDCEHLLVVGDETALPAIARLLEGLPADARGAGVRRNCGLSSHSIGARVARGECHVVAARGGRARHHFFVTRRGHCRRMV